MLMIWPTSFQTETKVSLKLLTIPTIVLLPTIRLCTYKSNIWVFEWIFIIITHDAHPLIIWFLWLRCKCRVLSSTININIKHMDLQPLTRNLRMWRRNMSWNHHKFFILYGQVYRRIVFVLWSQLLKRPKQRNMSELNKWKYLMCNKGLKKKKIPNLMSPQLNLKDIYYNQYWPQWISTRFLNKNVPVGSRLVTSGLMALARASETRPRPWTLNLRVLTICPSGTMTGARPTKLRAPTRFKIYKYNKLPTETNKR